MQILKIVSFSILLLLTGMSTAQTDAWIRINQLGYLETSAKVAVLVSKDPLTVEQFELRDALTDEVVFQAAPSSPFGRYAAFMEGYRLNFSAFQKPGRYYLHAIGVRSPYFRIGNDVYDGTADFILRYMRQQRSGYNPFLKDSCHTQDGFVIYHPDKNKDKTRIDVSGGWHDASDYLQYLPTTANATFQMLFAYRQNPGSFEDAHDAAGLPGKNGIPDIIDEAKWGIDWMLKMNPTKGEYYNQIADDRDHIRMRLPTLDSVHYDAPDGSLARPVYFLTGRPQGLQKFKNRTKGAASSAGKFASTFALASQVLKPWYPDEARKLFWKAKDAYEFGLQHPGATQTAPCRAPYFYEEDNYVDDMELAAIQLHHTDDEYHGYLDEAVEYGRTEPVTPWMGADTARHYQWYPFLNLGHYFIAAQNEGIADQFRNFLRMGIDTVHRKAKRNPFFNGVPFIWCSNNLTVAMLTQCHLYRTLTGDNTYLEMEAALRDWLFGCNPWGTSMICGLPEKGISPRDPHSAFTHLYQYKIDGGLVDGPVYGSIWSSLIGIKLYEKDEFEPFQSPFVVYHDDFGDYATNEPTMDGTASMSYILSALQKEGMMGRSPTTKDEWGAGIRGDISEKKIHLVFTGHEYADGAKEILKVLKKQGIKASFFLTGDFCRKFPATVKELKKEGHYIGAHSDKHLLYGDWKNRDSLLVTKEQFMDDLRANFSELEKAGIKKADAPIFIPPYEWYNRQIVEWAAEAGLEVRNFTPGTVTNADYTTPAMANYKSSEEIFNGLLQFEKEQENGLKGAYLLIHLGTDPARNDKFYNRLKDLIVALKGRGYGF